MSSLSDIKGPFVDIIDCLGIAIWELDLDLRVRKYNRKAREIYGEQAIGRHCYEVAANRDSICPDCPAGEILQGQALGRSTHNRTRADGQQITIDHIASPRFDENGRLSGIVVAIYDITEIIATQTELEEHQQELEKLVSQRTLDLQESEDKYRQLYEQTRLQSNLYQSVLQSSSDAIVIYDLEGRVRYMNPAFTKMFGWSLEEIANRRVPFLPESEREESLRRIKDLLEHGTSCSAFETVRHTKDGQLLDISLSASRYTDHQGRPAGMVVILRNITEQKKAEKEALKSHKLESIGVLAGGIAHDFNNILSAILGNISIALSLIGPESELYELLKASEKASLRARGLTRQLLTFARGGEPVKKVSAIGEIIRDCASFVLRGSNVKCDFSFAPDLRPVNIDADQISQVIQNVIINADQAMPDGGVIAIDCRNHMQEAQDHTQLKTGPYIIITITDQGQGISAKIIDKIFDPYFTTKKSGSGLGLAITHSIIRKHGGHIEIESQPGQGSRVIIYLPAANLETIIRQAAPPPRTDPVSGGRVLVVDDDEMIRELLHHILEIGDFSVVAAASGEEAIEYYREARHNRQPFDLVIMDLTIPGGMSGLEATRRLREIDPEARIIVSSGYSADPVMSAYEKYGFCAVLNKPFQIQEVLNTAGRVMAG